MHSALLKLAGDLAAAVSYYLCFGMPPVAAPTKHDKVYFGQPFEIVARPMIIFSAMAVFTSFACEALVILATVYPTLLPPSTSTAVLERLCPGTAPDLSALSHIAPAFLLGILTVLAAGQLRLWCFRALGDLFTFEVTLRPQHTLVTRGPYALARHPSYTATLLLMGGTVAAHAAPGSWVRECAVLDTRVGGWWIRAYLVLGVFALASLYRRGGVEDKMMREQFGAEWEAYAKRVPAKFIPGLI